jgi:hypothetical protein
LIALLPDELPKVGAELGLPAKVDGQQPLGVLLGRSELEPLDEMGYAKTTKLLPGRPANLRFGVGGGQSPQVVGGDLAAAPAGGALAVER